MSGLKKSLLQFARVFTQHPMCAANGVLVAVITGFEQAFEELVFKCPKKQTYTWTFQTNRLYSLMSILCPFVALWILGILGNNLGWRLCQGLKSRKEKIQECSRFWPCCGNLVIVLLRTSVIPLVWILIVLMDGDMYACYFWKPDDDDWNKDNKAESQLIGWIYLGVCLLLGLIAVFCHRYCSKRTYFPHIYSNKLKRAERLLLEELLKERAEQDAKRNMAALMMGYSEFSANDWESICREETKEEFIIVPTVGATGGTDTTVGATGGTVGATGGTTNTTVGATDVKKKHIQLHSLGQEFLAKHKDLLKKYDDSVAAAQGATTSPPEVNTLH